MLAKHTGPQYVRCGMEAVLTAILHQTGNYAGFNYLAARHVLEGFRPGIVWHGDPADDGTPEFPDPTRVYYYTHHKIWSAKPCQE